MLSKIDLTYRHEHEKRTPDMIPLDQLNTAEWSEVPALVEAIIARRMVKQTLKTRGDIRRPMRFAEFADENSYAPFDTVYSWIRGGVTPTPKNANKIKAWCKKHYAALTP